MIMTEQERRSLYEVLKRYAPNYLNRLESRYRKKRDMIMTCLDIASNGTDISYQDEVNRIYNTCCSMMNKTETYMLNYICLIRHREKVNHDISKDDEDIQKWIGYLQEFRNSGESVIGILDRQAKKLINQYRTKKPAGRPKGTGKRIFNYNGKEYHTIQECADEYGISKQGMHKKLKKLKII